MNKIIIIGPPGCGKGTQAKILAEVLGATHISPGEIFREEMSKKTTLGEQVRTYMEAGDLVPTSIVVDVIYDRVKSLKNGFILDGFPRTAEQSKLFAEKYGTEKKAYMRDIICLDIHLSDKESTKRIASRGRVDDKEKIHAKRIKDHREREESLRQHLVSKCFRGVYRIDGSKTKEEVTKQCLHKISIAPPTESVSV